VLKKRAQGRWIRETDVSQKSREKGEGASRGFEGVKGKRGEPGKVLDLTRIKKKSSVLGDGLRRKNDGTGGNSRPKGEGRYRSRGTFGNVNRATGPAGEKGAWVKTRGRRFKAGGAKTIKRGNLTL